nr:unnamed protein product [Spirometra erinaceieuropaei]
MGFGKRGRTEVCWLLRILVEEEEEEEEDEDEEEEEEEEEEGKEESCVGYATASDVLDRFGRADADDASPVSCKAIGASATKQKDTLPTKEASELY